MNMQFLESETFNQIEPRLFTRQEIAAFVVVARNLRHWSQENLAAEANITPRTVQRVEAADPIVGDVTFRRIEKAIDLPEGFFTTPMKLPTAEQHDPGGHPTSSRCGQVKFLHRLLRGPVKAVGGGDQCRWRAAVTKHR